MTERQRTITVEERATIPILAWTFAFGPMLPLLAGAAGAWLLGGAGRSAATGLTLLWAGAILLFLSGVRRGLSFRTEGGATFAQIATMLVIYCLGFAALLAFWLEHPAITCGFLIAGYAALLALDPIAAVRGEAPLYFARLRPLQLPLALVSLLALLLRMRIG